MRNLDKSSWTDEVTQKVDSCIINQIDDIVKMVTFSWTMICVENIGL